MQFSDSKNVGINADSSTNRRSRGGFFSYLFGSKSRDEKGVSEEKKDDDGNTRQDMLTSENLETHNDVIAGTASSRTDNSVESDMRSIASSRSSISRSSRGSRRSRASKTSVGSQTSRISRASRASHASHAGRGVHNPETIIEEGDEEEEGLVYDEEDESFQDMRKRMDVEELNQYPPGQRKQFWEERRKAFSDLPLPPPPSRVLEPLDGDAHGMASVEPETSSMIDATPNGSISKKIPSWETEKVKNNELSPFQRSQRPDSPSKGSDTGDAAPTELRLLDTFNRAQRVAFLRSTLPVHQRAALEQDLKSHRRLKRQFKHKLTVTTLSGDKKIPIPPPRGPPPPLSLLV